MNTPETKLTVETCNGAFSPAPSITFHNANREVLRITHDGHIICGEGLSVNAATQEAAKLLIASFEKEIQKMVDARLAVDTARLDWLQSNKGQVGWTSGREPNLPVASTPSSFGVIGATVRAAIDAAMKEASK